MPRDLEAHPHSFKEMMLRKFYPGLGFTGQCRVAFAEAYPQVVAGGEPAAV